MPLGIIRLFKYEWALPVLLSSELKQVTKLKQVTE